MGVTESMHDLGGTLDLEMAGAKCMVFAQRRESVVMGHKVSCTNANMGWNKFSGKSSQQLLLLVK